MIVYRFQNYLGMGLYASGALNFCAVSGRNHQPLPRAAILTDLTERHVFGWHDWDAARRWMASFREDTISSITELGEAYLYVYDVPDDVVLHDDDQCAFLADEARMLYKLHATAVLEPRPPVPV